MNNNNNEKQFFLDLFDRFGFLLTQSQKQVFLLYFQQNLTIAEIAKAITSSRALVFDTLKKTKAKLIKLQEKQTKNKEL